jgi:hypothetical protein
MKCEKREIAEESSSKTAGAISKEEGQRTLSSVSPASPSPSPSSSDGESKTGERRLSSGIGSAPSVVGRGRVSLLAILDVAPSAASAGAVVLCPRV